MRERRIGVADAMHDGELALVPEPFHRREKRREAVVPVEPQYLVVTDSDRLPDIAVERVVVRDDRVEIVVAARELDNEQHGVLLNRRHLGSSADVRAVVSRELIVAVRHNQVHKYDGMYECPLAIRRQIPTD